MNYEKFKLLNDIVFNVNHYHKNYDFINDGESIITEYTGTINKLNIINQTPPSIIGEFGYSIWNIKSALANNVNLNKLIKEHHIEDTYSELYKVINSKDLNIKKCNKLIIIHTLVITKKYRKCEITEEFIEMLYKTHYGDDTAMIALVRPFQDNIIDSDYYLNHKTVSFPTKTNSEIPVQYVAPIYNFKLNDIINILTHSENVKYIESDVIYQLNDLINVINNIESIKHVSAERYYSLGEFLDKKNDEGSEFRIFAVAAKCGFKRINDYSYLFKFYPEKIIERLNNKSNLLHSNISSEKTI